MKKIDFSDDLLTKYLAGECTPAEKAVVEAWYNKQLEQGRYQANHDDLERKEDDTWRMIQASQPSRQSATAKTVRLWRVVAASAACLAAIVILSIFLVKNNAEQAHTAARNITGIPKKQNNLIQLPDGSTVILDKASKLVFAKSFKGKRLREVYLTGTAFFDIKHINTQPFIVYSGKIKTTVLGTAFDISANPGSDQIVVRVIRGKVNVSTDKGSIGDLLPDKKVTYFIKADHSNFTSVNAKQEMGWTSEDMLLNDISFETICAQLEKRYGVSIYIKDEGLKSKKFTISLSANENLKSFLSTVCDFNGAAYVFDKEKNRFVISSIN